MKAANVRIQTAFRPKTSRCYDLLFRNFVGFCICNKIAIHSVSVEIILAYLEYMVINGFGVHMVYNNLSAIKAEFAIYGPW